MEVVLPADVEVVLDVDEVEGSAYDEIDEVVDGLWHEVVAGVDWVDDRAGEGCSFHVLDIDEREGCLAVAEDEGEAFFE